jgi:Mn-dependent DtxR family transcriptional regulator
MYIPDEKVTPLTTSCARFSESLEDYLEAIEMLGGKNVRSVDIANKLNVSKASVNRAVNTLIQNGLVVKALYGDISLTVAGVATSENVLKKHLVIKRFLVEVLGIDAMVAEQEACGIEHNISDETLTRFEKLVEHAGSKPRP